MKENLIKKSKRIFNMFQLLGNESNQKSSLLFSNQNKSIGFSLKNIFDQEFVKENNEI